MTSVLFSETLHRPLLRTEFPDMSLETSFNVSIDSFFLNLTFFFLDMDFKLLSNLSKYTIIYIIFHLVHKGVMKNTAKTLCLQHFCFTYWKSIRKENAASLLKPVPD